MVRGDTGAGGTPRAAVGLGGRPLGLERQHLVRVGFVCQLPNGRATVLKLSPDPALLAAEAVRPREIVDLVGELHAARGRDALSAFPPLVSLVEFFFAFWGEQAR